MTVVIKINRCIGIFLGLTMAIVLSAHPGIGLVMDQSGNVYYTDLENVWKLSPNGEKTIAVSNVHTHELYLDDDGKLYGEHVWYNREATDTWGYYIWCLHPDGTLKKIKEDKHNFPANNELVRTAEGTSYYSEKKGEGEKLMVQSLAENGRIRQYSDHVFEDIRWVHSPKCSDDVYVVDMLSIKRVDPNGDVHVVAENLKERNRIFSRVRDMHYLMGLTLDKHGRLYSCVYGEGKIVRIDGTGKQEVVY